MSHPSSTQPRRRVVITGIGAVTPCGNTAAETWAALIAGRSGIGPITRFDATGCTARIAGEVKNFDPARALPAPLQPRGPGSEPMAQALTQKDLKKFGRFTHLGTAAAVEAYADSGLDPHRAGMDAERMGVNLGVGLGGFIKENVPINKFASIEDIFGVVRILLLQESNFITGCTYIVDGGQTKRF